MAIWQKGREAAIKSYRKRRFCKTAVKLRSNCGHYSVNWLRNEVKTGYFGVKIVLNSVFFLLDLLLFLSDFYSGFQRIMFLNFLLWA